MSHLLSADFTAVLERGSREIQRKLPLFNALQRLTLDDLKAGRPVVDVHDLGLGGFCERTAYFEDLAGGDHQVLLWYPGEAIAIPVETVLDEYRLLDLKTIRGGVQ